MSTPQEMLYAIEVHRRLYLERIAYRVRNRNRLDIPAMREAKKRGNSDLIWKEGMEPKRAKGKR
jgi:hypothetical protein